MAADYITELLGYIGLDTDDKSFDEAQQQVAGIHKGMLGVIAVAGAMAAAVAGAAVALVNDFTETAVEADTLAKRVGVTTQELQKLSYAASAFGVEQDALVDGLKELSLRTDEFVKTGEGSGKESFQRLGLGAKQLGKYTNDTAGLFDLLLTKLRGVQDAAARQRLADELFGGTAAEQFIPMLTASAESIDALKQEAVDLGIVMSDESVKAAKAYSLEMKRVQGVFTGIKNQIASAVLPIILELTKSFREFLTSNTKLVVAGLTAAFQSLAFALKAVGIAALFALPYLIGSAAISGYRAAIGAIALMRGGFIALRTSAIAAWAAAYAGPALVGAAIAGLVLVFQDIYTYLNGGKSVTGLIVDKFSEAADSVKKKWQDLKVWFKGLFDELAGYLQNLLPDWLRNFLIEGKMTGPDAISTDRGPDINWSYPGMPMPANGVTNNDYSYDYSRPNNSVINQSYPGTSPASGAPVMPGRVPAPAPYSTAPLPASATTTNNAPTVVNRVQNLNVNGVQDGVTFAQRFTEEMRRQNATVIKNTDNGQEY